MTFRQAEELLGRRAYEGAVQVLESIPGPLRTAEIAACLSSAQSRWKELVSLSGEIRALVAEKRTADLLPKIERLLMLKPDHAQAQKLATQLRDQLVDSAKKRLNEHQYADALQLLRQIPSFAKSGEVEKLQDQALELSTLLAELRLAPLALPSTYAVLQKLVKFAPGNEQAVSLVEKFKTQISARPAELRLAAPAWASPPRQPRLKIPVDWLGHFVRLSCQDKSHAKTLREHPGEFFVALGLALQGIEEADISINLLPAEKSGLLGKLPFSFGKKGPSAAWGIDLGEHALRAVCLAREAKSGNIQLQACCYIQHDLPLSQAEEGLQREKLSARTLKEFLRRADMEGTKIIASLSGHRILGRFFDLPPMAANKVAETVQYEAKHQIPVPLDELSWAYEVLGEVQQRGGKEQDSLPRKILLVAARLAHVQAQVKLFKTAGMSADALVPDCVALHNGFRFEFEGNKVPGAFALLDVGLKSSNLVVSGPRSVWFRSFGIGGEDFTQSLATHFQLTRDQAEGLKRNPAKARRYSLYCAAQEPLLIQLVSEVERSLASYARYNSAQLVERMYGVGGGFQTPGLVRYLCWGK